MLAVCLVTAPLVASQFHVISATGLLINVVLIPVTSAILIVGFSAVGTGLIAPAIAAPCVVAFDSGLSGLRNVVMTSASLSFGSVTIADCAWWLIAAFYLLLALTQLPLHRWIVRGAWLVLAAFLPLSLWAARQPADVAAPTMAFLSVGHGNASVMETPGGDVLLFDAGALSRGERTSDVVCRYLWSRGHRMISAIVISHPDLDHYNGIEGILRRMVVGRLITTEGFARSDSAAVMRVLQAAQDQNIPISIAQSGDRIHGEGYDVRFADVGASEEQTRQLGDNDRSLVSIVDYGTVVSLPGDLEEQGQQALQSELGTCDILVAPHHGSSDANTTLTATVFQPKHVIVSARDHSEAAALRETYGRGVEFWFTSESGAVTARLVDSQPAISAYRSTVEPFEER